MSSSRKTVSHITNATDATADFYHEEKPSRACGQNVGGLVCDFSQGLTVPREQVLCLTGERADSLEEKFNK